MAADPGADFVGLDAAPLPTAIAAATSRIGADAIRDHIAWLSDPRREGRGLGSRGLATAEDYVAARLAATGLEPSFQAVPLREVRPAGGAVAVGSATARSGRDCVLPEAAPQVIEGAVVFAGYGIREPGLGHDDFRDLDVRGRIVAFRSGVPPGPEWQRPDLIERYATARAADRYDTRLELLDDLGAKAAIAIEDDLATGIRADRYFVAAAGAPPPPMPPLARVGRALGSALQAPGAKASIRIAGDVREVTGRNVVALLRGSDPALAREAVVVGAHLDHLGLEEGALHPGADDNASGIAALLEIARSIAAAPSRPRRTLVFVFWTGEEAGQFGSQHWVRDPLWPLAATTTYINLDMIAHPWTVEQIRDLVTTTAPALGPRFLAEATPDNFAEPGLDRASPWLGDALAAAARGTGMTLHLDRTDGRHGGSDYRAFARAGKPFVRFFGNYFPAYHEPGDTLENLDPAQVARMARLALATAWIVADR